MCKISVITPVYNVERYLRECLDSLVRQSMQDVEFICVNDGSKDGSLAILNEYAAKDSRFKIISQKNQGYGKAMNVGIKAASGDYIAILESDDFIGGDMLRFLYDVAVRNNADIVKSNFYFSSVEKNVKSDFQTLI